ncbi:hypothetical protein [Streptomyces sp. BPTC-684]|uniref:hypothetical protein n=1 Tax=Streptomyces sp. BPTC-684 TaxID=3043734 RepID=UPI0024B1B0F1|nr:hypothetical protein [Streptomyces sp. BPTC-684]WHM36605.1 hypothetical protein QIY60_06395 [Streptomyces sp. BPTC-684]
MSRLRPRVHVDWAEARHRCCLAAVVLTWLVPCVSALRSEATEPVDLLARVPPVSVPDLPGPDD